MGVGSGGGLGSGRMQGRERLIYFICADDIVLPQIVGNLALRGIALSFVIIYRERVT